MNKKRAFGAIDLLLGLVVTAIIFITMMPMLKNTKSDNQKQTKELQNVQTQVDNQVNQIQQARDKVQQEQNQVENNNY